MKKTLLFLIVSSFVFMFQATIEDNNSSMLLPKNDWSNHIFATLSRYKNKSVSANSGNQSFIKRQVSFSQEQDNINDNKRAVGLSIRRPQSLASQASLHDCGVNNEGTPTPPSTKNSEKDANIRLRSFSNASDTYPILLLKRSLKKTRSNGSFYDCTGFDEGQPSPYSPDASKEDHTIRFRSFSNASIRSRANSSESFAGDYVLRSFSTDSTEQE